MTVTPDNPGAQLRRLLAEPGMIRAINIYDPLSARVDVLGERAGGMFCIRDQAGVEGTEELLAQDDERAGAKRDERGREERRVDQGQPGPDRQRPGRTLHSLRT